MSTNRFLTFLNNTVQLVTAIATSAGATDASKVVQTFTDGRIHSSLMPVGIGATTKTYIASEALDAGNFINIWLDNTDPQNILTRVRKADASNGRRANGFVLSAVASGANATVTLSGLNTGLTGLTIGSLYYLGTAGGVTLTPSTTANSIIQDIGSATAATEVNFRFSAPILVV